MNWLLWIAFILNLIIIVCEIWIFSKIRKKINIIKYYTFLQNFITLVVGIIFLVYSIMAIFQNSTIPEFVRGIRYVATCGLVVTMFIYSFFLSKNSKNLLSEKDFGSTVNPRIANFILHYFCPIASFLSFVFFEREIKLTSSLWTSFAAVPSCLYWLIYLVLSITKLWEEPYDFTKKNSQKKNILLEFLIMMIIPVSFILISYILWLIK